MDAVILPSRLKLFENDRYKRKIVENREYNGKFEMYGSTHLGRDIRPLAQLSSNQRNLKFLIISFYLIINFSKKLIVI